MATQVDKRPTSLVDTDSRPTMTRDHNAAPRARRIPQDPQPVPQQRAQRSPTVQPKYPAGYFFG